MSNTLQPIKTIGGYMGLQVQQGKSYYPDLICLNTARNSLEYVLITKGYTKIYLPYFTCEVIMEPIKRLQLYFDFYHIDENMDPIIDFKIDDLSCMLYTNYFGVKSKTVEALSLTQKNLIIDNAQAFYARPIPGIDTFYSCRKFFGVSDGAYLYTSGAKRLKLERDVSVNRFSHLVKEIDLGIEKGYADYVQNNNVLIDNDIKEMSALTHALLGAVDYDQVAKQRQENFFYLHQELGSVNLLKLEVTEDEVPMVYPLLLNQADLKTLLIKHKIFVATYWPNVFEWTLPDSIEYYLAQNIVPLPIDQRYTIDDMKYMLQVLKSLMIAAEISL